MTYRFPSKEWTDAYKDAVNNNPEYAIAFYEVLGDVLPALGTADRRAGIIAAVLKPTLERLIRKEKGRLKKKHELEELVGE